MDAVNSLIWYLFIVFSVWIGSLLWINKAISIYFDQRTRHHIALMKEIKIQSEGEKYNGI